MPERRRPLDVVDLIDVTTITSNTREFVAGLRRVGVAASRTEQALREFGEAARAWRVLEGIEPPTPEEWEQAGRAAIVDGHLTLAPELLDRIPPHLRGLPLRHDPPGGLDPWAGLDPDPAPEPVPVVAAAPSTTGELDDEDRKFF